MFAIGLMLVVAAIFVTDFYKISYFGPCWAQVASSVAFGSGLGLMCASVVVFLWKNMP